MMKLSRKELLLAARHDFAMFVILCFYELNPGAQLSWCMYNELMCAKVELTRKGIIRRLIVNIPPRHLKSLIFSIALPAWLLGHNPRAQIMSVCYGQDLADKLARDCVQIMQSDFYRQIFSTRLSPKRTSAHDFETTEGGCRFATSVGGTMTGRGADYIILDDPQKPDEALSDAQRNSINLWFSHSLYSRLNSKSDGVIILVMQRLHEDDLTAHVQERESWEVLSLPATAEQDEDYVFSTILGTHTWHRKKGDVLDPKRENAATLKAIRSNLGEFHYSAQYQQSPVPLDGGYIKHAWIRRYKESERPAKFDSTVQSWDTANKASELSAFSVCTTWGVKGRSCYLLNVWRKKVDFPDLKRAVLDQARAFNADTILIEDKASGTSLIAEIRTDISIAVHPIRPEGDKFMRLVGESTAFENGFVLVPEDAHWLAVYLHELTSFPRCKYFDQVDSTSQFLHWRKDRGPGWGIFEYYRREVEETDSQSTEVLIKLRVPGDITHVSTITSRVIQIPPNRIIEVSIDEAPSLQMAGFLPVTEDVDVQ